MKTLKFFRAGFSCMIRFDDQTQCFWGFIGFEPGHHWYDSVFIDSEPVQLAKLKRPPEASSEALMKKHWFGFMGTENYEKTIELVKQTADYIETMPA